MGGNSWNSHKEKEFGQKLFDPFAEGLLRCRRLHIGVTKRPETLFKSVLLRCPRLVLVTSRQARISIAPPHTSILTILRIQRNPTTCRSKDAAMILSPHPSSKMILMYW